VRDVSFEVHERYRDISRSPFPSGHPFDVVQDKRGPGSLITKFVSVESDEAEGTVEALGSG
jgi:hypothetical protein